MFGIASLSQVPFSSLANNAFTADVTENLGLEDTSSQTYAYTYPYSENIIVGDFNSQAGLFFAGVVEAITSADINIDLRSRRRGG